MEARKAFSKGNSFDTREAVCEKLVCLCLYPACDSGLRRPAFRRIVFEAAVFWRIMRRRDYNAVGKAFLAPAVVCENRMGNGRRRSIFISIGNHDIYPVCRKHLQGSLKGRHGYRVGVYADKERAVDLVLFAVQADGLCNGEDMRFIEGIFKRGPAMPGGAEGDPCVQAMDGSGFSL